MIYGIYRFYCCFKTRALVPVYKGSTFRGVFGMALKQVVCALKNQTCKKCLLKDQCVYAITFETDKLVSPSKDSVVYSRPLPYVIEPWLDSRTEFKGGELFDFNLLLFGKINSQLPYFIYAFDKMGEIGIGSKIDNERGRFELIKVEDRGTQIYSGDKKLLDSSMEPDILSLNSLSDYPEKVSSLELTFITPLRFKFNNRLANRLPFNILTKAMLRRVSTLLSCYGDGKPDLDYKGMIKRAEAIQVVEDNLRWTDWSRYSGRQKVKMEIGGLTGSIVYGGDLREFMPLIEFCSKTHIGKQTSFGLGKMLTPLPFFDD